MNLDELKEALGDDKHKALVEYVGDLIGQRDTARKESIEGRKTLRAKAESLEKLSRKLFDKLGVDSEEEVDALPDGKGQAEVAKQLQATVKRLERERDDATKGRNELAQLREKDRRAAVVAQAVAKHGFVDADTASLLLGQRIRVEGDEVLFEAEGGKLVPVDEGAAWLAKTKPFLVKAQGSSGSGFREGSNNGQQGAKRITRAEFEGLSAEDRAKTMREKAVITD